MSDEMKEMIRLIPVVLDKISTEGIEKKLFLGFFRQVSSDIYPVRNIAFLLWVEVVWYNKDTSSAVRYSDETKKFWKLGYQLFDGRFVRFMSGFKNESQIVFGEAIKGQCAPDKADINLQFRPEYAWTYNRFLLALVAKTTTCVLRVRILFISETISLIP